MLTGLPPYYNQPRRKTFNKIKFKKLKYPEYFSPLTCKFLDDLFIKDPYKRLGGTLGAEEVKKHPWFAKVNW